MPEPTLIMAGVIEMLKLGIQYQIARARADGLTNEQIGVVLDAERERFKQLTSEPLPEV